MASSSAGTGTQTREDCNTYVRVNSFRSSKKNHNSSRKCPTCRKKFASSQNVKRHILNIHMKYRSFKCPVCRDRFPTKQALGMHRLMGHNHRCQFQSCDLAFTTRSTLNQHYQSHHKQQVTDEDENNNDRALIQEYKVKGNSPKFVKFQYSDSSISSDQNSDLEDSDFDPSTKSYNFRQLNRIDYSEELTTENQDHVEIDAAPLFCRPPSILKSGPVIERRRKGRKKRSKADAVCLYCKRKFVTRYKLAVHVRIHTGEKPYACPYSNCGKAFSQKISMTQHIRTHTGDKPFSCPACKKRFARSANLKSHQATCGQAPTTTKKIEGAIEPEFKSQVQNFERGMEKTNIINMCSKSPNTDHGKVGPSDLPDHIALSLNRNIIQYTCKFCAGKFSYRVDAFKHACLFRSLDEK